MAQVIVPLIRLGSRIAARFAEVGLTEPLPELHGQAIAPMEFDVDQSVAVLNPRAGMQAS